MQGAEQEQQHKPAAPSREKAGRGRWEDGVAIVGMSARFPRARDVGEFWKRLVDGEDMFTDLSAEHLREVGVDPATLANPDYVRRGGAIDDAEAFDAEFFGLSRREAEIMDPQQRIFLESCSEALEHAGHTGAEGRVGVFAGVGINTYLFGLLQNPAILASAGAYQLMLGNDKDYLATRVAYKLDLHGPAVVVQTACSTSLAAVHLACTSILAGECAMALAGGVSIAFPQNTGYLYMPGMILSKDGFCRPFDADAGGTVPGRGSGVVVLKRLGQAVADGDTVYAVIRGSAWNNDGAAKAGYMVPSVDGQAEVIRAAHRAAGVSAGKIGYVETHGTATELGDPIEFAALEEVFGDDGARPGACLLGAVKSNMGHADVASGVAGLIKATMAVHTGIVPPTLHFRSPNPHIDLQSSPFAVSGKATTWGAGGAPRWAGVSSFGIGGTNVHVVLSSAPEPSREQGPSLSTPQIIPISARTPSALVAASGRLADRLEAEPTLRLGDVARTLQSGRRHFAVRRAEVAGSTEDLLQTLRGPDRDRATGRTGLGRDAVFLFPGQGSQFPGMARDLYERDRSFRRVIDAGAEVLRALVSFDPVRLLVGDGSASPQSSSQSASMRAQLRSTEVAQPTLFLLQYALAARWRSLGVQPAALLGHSLGELVAAAVAGVFSFEDGLRLAAERGRLMGATAAGLMLAVSVPAEGASRLLEGDLWVAAENGPRLTVIAGTTPAVERLERRLATDRIASMRLLSQNAFHTPLMAEAASAFRRSVEATERHAPTVPWLSNVTGGWIEAEAARSAQYWGNQILARVRFTQNLLALAGRPRLLVELGPGEVLTGLVRQQMRGSVAVPTLGAETRKCSDYEIFLRALARAWEAGAELDWGALAPETPGRRIPLPTYPFERERCWVGPATGTPVGASDGTGDGADRNGSRSFATNEVASSAVPASSSSEDTKRADLSTWFSAPFWKSTPPPASLGSPTPTSETTAASPTIDCWLLLEDGSTLAGALRERLRAGGATVISVRAGERFAAREGDVYIVHPARASDFAALWQELARREIRPGGLLDLWTRRETTTPAFDSLMLAAGAAARHRHRLRQIEVVTEGLESVAGEATGGLGRAEVLGLLLTLPTEYAGTRCRLIDLEGVEGREAEQAAQITGEIAFRDDGATVAYRRGRRWVKGWTPVTLPSPAKSPFRVGGTYLIPGGLGGVGFSFARHLLRHFQAKILVTGRSELPRREAWERILASDGGASPDARRIRRLQELEQAGGEVRFLAADVSDRASVEAAIAEAHRNFGPIHGVLHAAGVAGAGRIAAQTPEETYGIRAPKVGGSRVLAELLRSEDLDFFVLCSSVSAVVPAPAQSAYAAGNLFQNALAEFCREQWGMRAIAIGFDAWQEVGMAAEMVLPEGFEAVQRELQRTAMTPEEGVEVIRRVVAGWTGGQILVTTLPLDRLLARSATVPEPQNGPSVAAEEEGLPGERELAGVLAIWRDLLGQTEIQPSENFFELGGHSLLGTMVISRIRQRFGVVLTLRTLFEAPTPAALAGVVRSRKMELAVESDEDREEFEL